MAKESSQKRNHVVLNSTITHITPTRNILEAPKLGTPHSNGQKVGSQWCPSKRGYISLEQFKNTSNTIFDKHRIGIHRNVAHLMSWYIDCLHMTPSSFLPRLAFLRIWRGKYYSTATYRNLAKCFYNAGNDKMVTAIREILQPLVNPPSTPPSNPPSNTQAQQGIATCTHATAL